MRVRLRRRTPLRKDNLYSRVRFVFHNYMRFLRQDFSRGEKAHEENETKQKWHVGSMEVGSGMTQKNN